MTDELERRLRLVLEQRASGDPMKDVCDERDLVELVAALAEERREPDMDVYEKR